MVTHDHDLAKSVDRTIVVADGEIVNQDVVGAYCDPESTDESPKILKGI